MAARAKVRLDQAGFSDRVNCHGGNFHADALPTGADVISLVRVLLDHDDGNVLSVHLGMSGRMVVDSSGAPPAAHDHVIFTTDLGVEIRFNDPRRFGLMTLAPREGLEGHKLFRHLGPDPLTPAFTPAVLSAALKGRKTSIKASGVSSPKITTRSTGDKDAMTAARAFSF